VKKKSLDEIEKEANRDRLRELDPMGDAEIVLGQRAQAVLAVTDDVTGLSPYVELCVYAGDADGKALRARTDPAARILRLAKEVATKRPRLVAGLLYLCARQLNGTDKRPVARAAAIKLIKAALARREGVPMIARMWAESFYKTAKLPTERAALLADPTYALASSDPMSNVKMLARLTKDLGRPLVLKHLTRLATAVARMPPDEESGFEHDHEAIAERIRKIAGEI
jgi:hypothetical protein